MRAHLQFRPGERVGPVAVDRFLAVEPGVHRYGVRHERSGRALVLELISRHSVDEGQAIRRHAEQLKSVRNRYVHPVLAVLATRLGPARLVPVLEGPTLDEVLRDGPLGRSDGLDLLVSGASALAALHEHGVVHRSIEPGRFVRHEGSTGRRWVLCRCGLPPIPVDELRWKDGEPSPGDRSWLAPEQIPDALAGDHRVDLYSLGKVVQTACAGASESLDGRLEILTRELADQRPDSARTVLRELRRSAGRGPTSDAWKMDLS